MADIQVNDDQSRDDVSVGTKVISVITTHGAEGDTIELKLENGIETNTDDSKGEAKLKTNVVMEVKTETIKKEKKDNEKSKNEQKKEKKSDDEKDKEVEMPKPLTDEEIDKIVKKCSKMNEKDLKKYMDFFWSVDTERLGYFDIHQFAYTLWIGGHRLQDREITNIFVDLDYNCDLLVSLDEYLEEMSRKRLNTMGNEYYREWFKVFDANKDGYVCRQDIRDTMDNMKKYMLPLDIDKVMRFDKRGKYEKLDFEDFCRAVKADK